MKKPQKPEPIILKKGAEFHRLFKYDPEAGVITNKTTRGKAKAGDEAGGAPNNEGYKYVYASGKHYSVHRVAWMLSYGYFPEHEVDHINGIRDDNRLCNLREVSHTCNMQNQKLAKNNASGYKGVSWNSAGSKWVVSGSLYGKRIHLGYFIDKDRAVAARVKWEDTTPGWDCNSRKEGR